jgi:pyruvate formate lyase activating enzyme
MRATAGCGAALAGEWILSGSPWLHGLLGHATAGAEETDALADLIRRAPPARFWTSTATARTAADCRGCHPSRELPSPAAYDHERTVVQCRLCAQNCMIAPGERGRCRARMNVDGELKSLVYGRPISIHVDPIEKKPFYHFLPGSAAYSLATSGCPLKCRFCQNWQISQARPEDYDTPFMPADRIVDRAIERNASVIAFTYSEPTVFTEYLLDIARGGRPRGRRSVLVSCGFMNERPLAEMCEALEAIKIDLKGYSPDFYRNVCGAELAPVLRSIRQVARSGVHLELVNLVVPTLNDSTDMLIELAKWIVGEIGPDVPIHFTRFHPDYQLQHLPPTPVSTLERARDIAMQEGMRYAYVGNVPGHPGNHTTCPGCGHVVIERAAFFIVGFRLVEGACERCGRKIPGVWS